MTTLAATEATPRQFQVMERARELTGDPALVELHQEVLAYPGPAGPGYDGAAGEVMIGLPLARPER